MNKLPAPFFLLVMLIGQAAAAGVLSRDAKTMRYVQVKNGALQLMQERKGGPTLLVSVEVPAETEELKYTQYCGFVDVATKPNEVFIGLAQKSDPNIDDVTPQRVWRVQLSTPAIEEEHAVSGYLCDNPWALAN